MAFDLYQRNICVEIHLAFQTTGTELPFCFNLEGFTVFLQNTYSSSLIYVLKIITHKAFKLFWQLFCDCIKHI